MKLLQTNDYLLLIDEEVEIKPNKYALNIASKEVYKTSYSYRNLDKITGARSIIAYRKLNEEAKELDLPELPPFEVDIEELAENIRKDKYHNNSVEYPDYNIGFEEGYKTAQSKQFSLEDMKKAIEMAREDYYIRGYQVLLYSTAEIIGALYVQQLPKEFIPEYEEIPNFERSMGNIQENYKYQIKTTTNSSGKIELVGTYKY